MKNLGNTDRIIRLSIAIILGILYATNIISGIFGMVLLGIGIILAITSFVSFCPLYRLVGIRSCPVSSIKK